MQFKIENIIIECDQLRLTINKEKVECSDKLLKAFNLFLNSKNETISKNQLINSLWEGSIVSDDSLFKVIQLIRNIFKAHNLNDDVLINVYGKGYKIAPKIHIITTPTKQLKIDQPQKPNKLIYSTGLKSSIIIFMILVIIMFATWFYSDKSNLITQQDYVTIKSQILSNPIKAQNSLSAFNEHKLSKVDRQIIYALKGQSMYHQGNYKESIESLLKSVSINPNKNTIALADSFFVLAKIHLYKADDVKLLEYTNHARSAYQALNDIDGILKSKDLMTDYLVLVHQYQGAIKNANELLNDSTAADHILGQIIAQSSLHYVYSQINEVDVSIIHIKATLDLALKYGNEKYISYASGTLAMHSLDIGKFEDSMKWANLTLKNANKQVSTNNFQQGFSYMYNILSPLGHDQLAEKYLQKAIDVQNHFNSDGHLHTAEINLGILKIKLKKYDQASQFFNQILEYNLSQSERITTQSWLAINNYFLKDYISAYTSAKSILNNESTTDRNKFIAGMALILSAVELERIEEAEQNFDLVKTLANPNWLIEYQIYLNMAVKIANNNDIEDFIKKKSSFEVRLNKIKESTKPNSEHLRELDQYLERILK